MNEWILLGLALLMIAANALFVAAEFSLVTVDRPLVAKAAESGDTRARGILAALKSLSTQLSGAQLGITVTSLVVGLVAEPSLARLMLGPFQTIAGESAAVGWAFGVALFIATVLQMVFGELVPKNLAIARPYPVARAVSGPQRAFTTATKPAIDLFNGMANRLLRTMGVEPVEELASARSAQELVSLVQRSSEQGTLDQGTARLLIRSFKFGDLTAADVMQPRRRIRTLEVESTVAELITLTQATGHSRFPVLDEGVDDPVGLVHIKHAIAVPVEERSKRKVADVMVPPVIVLESTELDPLLDLLRRKGLQMAIVVDEYGGTAGLVTLEDLVEEIVGDITDEHDRPNPHAYRRRDGLWSLSGLLRPDEASELSGVSLPASDDYDTIGGLFTSELGRIPKVGDQVWITIDGAHVGITVQRMDALRVDRLLMDASETTGRPEDTERADE
ncbi:MAG: hemolysin family protein [Actinomycetota bacterium]